MPTTGDADRYDEQQRASERGRAELIQLIVICVVTLLIVGGVCLGLYWVYFVW